MLTIDYELKTKLRSLLKVRQWVNKLHQMAKTLPFEHVSDVVEVSGDACNYLIRPDNDPYRWIFTQATRYVDDPNNKDRCYMVAPQYVIAFSTVPGSGCDSAEFGFCKYPATITVTNPKTFREPNVIRTGLPNWRWHGFCKTAYAGNEENGGTANFLKCHIAVIRMLDYAKSLEIHTTVHDDSEYWEHRDLVKLSNECGMDALGARSLVPLVGKMSIEALMMIGKLEDVCPTKMTILKSERQRISRERRGPNVPTVPTPVVSPSAVSVLRR